MRSDLEESAKRSIVLGALICAAVAGLLCALMLSRLVLPGLLGEWFSLMVGLLTTPFLMEFSLIILGFCLVIGLNMWRRRHEGDDFRYLEQVKQPVGLPEHAKWAIYKEKPLDPPDVSILDLAEGALAAGDFDELAHQLSKFDHEQLENPEVIRLRIGLAEGTGKSELAAILRGKQKSFENKEFF